MSHSRRRSHVSPLNIPIEMKLQDESRSQSHCPIANRIKESDPDIYRVSVVYHRNQPQRNFIAFSRRSTKRRYYYKIPDEAIAFLIEVDRGEHPTPFQLRLDESMVYQSYRIGPPVGDKRADSQPPIPRGPRLRPIPAP